MCFVSKDSIVGKDRAKIDIPNNAVNAQREKFEQGLGTQELENNILRTTYLERQRELDMLRSRFNRNKEMAQAAAGSCIRTSESSEGKSNSPKNFPICPVKPTPAPVSKALFSISFIKDNVAMQIIDLNGVYYSHDRIILFLPLHRHFHSHLFLARDKLQIQTRVHLSNDKVFIIYFASSTNYVNRKFVIFCILKL